VETLYRIKTFTTSNSVLFLKGYAAINAAMVAIYVIFFFIFGFIEHRDTLPCHQYNLALLVRHLLHPRPS